MEKRDTGLPGVFVIEPQVVGDRRGYFFESYRREAMVSFGVDTEFVQDNQSSSRKDTLRGLHYQLRQPQAKLCRVIRGEVLDVSVDIRRGSPTFGRWTAVRLSAENHRQVFIPRGMAHGFLVLSDTAELVYKCDAYYQPGDEYGIAWNDPGLAIAWGIATPILSRKDSALPCLQDIAQADLPVYREA
ncbi:MAG: dTDP-4-dehydrorhamnose 3,5-epimerase [Lentisphaerae bacterium]|nr:dTDP-4-dehydrorhamnose 3,5-epimerase [Lentisphaerota bacterium]